MASIIHINRATDPHTIVSVEIRKRVYDLLAHHTLRVRLVIIAFEHGSTAPSKPFALEAIYCIDV